MSEQTNGEILAEFEKSGTEVVRISRGVFREREVVDVRVYYQDDSGCWQPSKKGICLRQEAFPGFAAAVAEAAAALVLPHDGEQ